MNTLEVVEATMAVSKEQRPATGDSIANVGSQTKRTRQQAGGPEVNGMSSDGSHLFVFTNEKAGMKSVDKERANRIIYEMSKNSSYFRQAELQDQKVDAKVAEMKVKLRALGSSRKAQLTRQADRIATELEAQRELDGVCMVVDMDMFYAAVEIRDRPELTDKPVAVGGEGMISTTNYHARLKGVRSAMPGFIGRKLCPELVFVKPDYDKYSKVAETIRAIFREYDPRMRSYSLDEAYLNVTQALTKKLDESAAATVMTPDANSAGTVVESVAISSLSGSASSREDRLTKAAAVRQPKPVQHRQLTTAMEEEEEEESGGRGDGESGEGPRRTRREEHRARMFEAARIMAEEIRARIKEATKLTASVGIGPNFMLAKIASDWNKPDGQMCIGGDRGEVLRFLHDLPVRKVGGVGKVTEKCLREAMGVVTCGELFRERAACMHVMTPHTSRWLIKVSLGIGSSDHDVATEQAEAAGAVTRKQISKERTFSELYRPQDLLAKCREICDSLAKEMETKGLEAKTVGLKVKTTKFQVRTLDSTRQAYICTADELYATASALLKREIQAAATSAPGGKLRLRLMGVRASSFRGQAGAPLLPGQPTLDGFLAPKVASARHNDGHVGAASSGEGKAGKQEDRDRRVAVVETGLETVPAGIDKRKPRTVCGAQQAPMTVHSEATLVTTDPFAGTPVLARATALGAPSQSPGGMPRARSPRCAGTTQVRGLRGGSATGGPWDTAAAPATTGVTCPVCGTLLGAVSNAALNRHVDACLGVCAIDEGHDRGPAVGQGGALGAVTAVAAATRSGGDGFGPRRPKGVHPRKRAKVSAAGIERFLTPKERT